MKTGPALLLSFVLTACSGGSGGTNNLPPPTFGFGDASGSGQTVTLDFALAATHGRPVLLTFDIVLDDTLLHLDGLTALATPPVDHGSTQPGLHRVVLGQPGTTEALPSGPIVQLKCARRTASPFTTVVRIENLVAVNANGDGLGGPGGLPPLTARVTMQ